MAGIVNDSALKGPVKEKKRRKKKRPAHKSKMITGYIIYASEIRKDVIKKYPDKDFGFISKLVGVEWKNLPKETKYAYEQRAQEQNIKSKAIAAEALELKKLADAAEARAKEQADAQQQQQSLNSSTLPSNGYIVNGFSQTTNITTNKQLVAQDSSQSPSFASSSTPQSPMFLQPNMQFHSDKQQYQIQRQLTSPIIIKSNSMQQQPLQIIQQQQQQTHATTVQYCNTNGCPTSQQQAHDTSQSPANFNHQVQYQKNNIVYRKPATVRLRPKDATTQTAPIVRVNCKPKKPLRFSQKFIDYLQNIQSKKKQQQQSVEENY